MKNGLENFPGLNQRNNSNMEKDKKRIHVLVKELLNLKHKFR